MRGKAFLKFYKKLISKAHMPSKNVEGCFIDYLGGMKMIYIYSSNHCAIGIIKELLIYRRKELSRYFNIAQSNIWLITHQCNFCYQVSTHCMIIIIYIGATVTMNLQTLDKRYSYSFLVWHFLLKLQFHHLTISTLFTAKGTNNKKFIKLAWDNSLSSLAYLVSTLNKPILQL